MSYANLMSLIETSDKSYEVIAKSLYCSSRKLEERIRRGSDISVLEAVLIQERFFNNYSLSYLFEAEGGIFE